MSLFCLTEKKLDYLRGDFMKRFLLLIISALTIMIFVSCDIGPTPIINKITTTDKSVNFEFEELNETIKGTLDLNEGDTIEAAIYVSKGSYFIKVERNNKEIPYEGNVSSNGSFSFKASEKGKYTFSLKGEKASGNISFKKTVLEEDKNKKDSEVS